MQVKIGRRLVGGLLAGLAAAGMVYSGSCMLCVAQHNTVSPEDYARMAQEIVVQSLQTGPDECLGR